MEAIKNRYEFVVLFDVENGNPNGDPDAGNMPRIDPETSIGIVSDVCLKRKIRNYIDLCMEGSAEEDGTEYRILIKPDRSLNSKFEAAYTECGLKTNEKKRDQDDVTATRDYMCRKYYDVRTFGAVMSTGDNPCGIVRGPVQISFAHSIDPVLAQEMTITRQAVTKDADLADKGPATMGKKSYVPYGLYRTEGYVSAMLAQRVTGFSDADLELLWTAIINMFEHDHSAARGKMCVRKLIVFKHESALGNAPSATLFEKVVVKKKDGVMAPRSFADYDVQIDTAMPSGVTLDVKL